MNKYYEPIEHPKDKCPTCDWSDVSIPDCPTCHGTGKQPESKSDNKPDQPSNQAKNPYANIKRDPGGLVPCLTCLHPMNEHRVVLACLVPGCECGTGNTPEEPKPTKKLPCPCKGCYAGTECQLKPHVLAAQSLPSDNQREQILKDFYEDVAGQPVTWEYHQLELKRSAKLIKQEVEKAYKKGYMDAGIEYITKEEAA